MRLATVSLIAVYVYEPIALVLSTQVAVIRYFLA